MPNIKTKYEKHANDNEKRCKSIKEKEKAKFNQSKIIQQALSNSSLGNNSSKKIIFDDENDNTYTNNKVGIGNEPKSNGKCTLFDDLDSDNETFEIKEKTQFSGKKGFELLNLQSTYGNDERFKIDERFLEDEADEVEDKKINIDDADAGGEKTRQLKILEDVLGTSIIRPEKERKVKKRTFEMIRYDMSNKDHEIYEKNVQNESKKVVSSKKRKENRKTLRTDSEELPKTKVSKDKFYEVSSEIQNHFKEKEDNGAEFSLLQTYGLNGTEKEEEFDEMEKEKDVQEFPESDFESNKAPQKEEQINDKKLATEEKTVIAKGIWKESFFFVENDERFKEGLDFINKKESPEAIEAAENYDKTRKILREILRLHLKKQMKNKDPFRNKVGGMNKKQLANSRFKNPRTLFNRGKTAKVVQFIKHVGDEWTWKYGSHTKVNLASWNLKTIYRRKHALYIILKNSVFI